MSLNSTPSSERVHIGIFGRRNAGKSSLLNALTGQDMAIVSEVRGTTTDPVKKAMELLPLGPVVLIDTPGIDDEGDLGELRIKKSYQALNRTDIAVVVLDGETGLTSQDRELLERIGKKEIPCLAAVNKTDLTEPKKEEACVQAVRNILKSSMGNIPWEVLPVSAASGKNIFQMKELLAHMLPEENAGRRLAGDLVQPGDLVMLVIPIDKAAPKGRLILPQQQTIRDLLEAGAGAVAVTDRELPEMMEKLGDRIRLVITDSQVFQQVGKQIPREIPLTSFSILFARYKGELDIFLKGTEKADALQEGDRILVCEGCTHHRQCNDIGTVKIPGWLEVYTGKKLQFTFTSGGDFPEDLTEYQMIIHCGGCTLNAREMRYRIACAEDAKVPITNYGMLIAKLKGILERSVRPVRKEN